MIEAEYLLSTPYKEMDIYIFLDRNIEQGHFFCRSFFQKGEKDYTKGQAVYTLLKKEKTMKKLFSTLTLTVCLGAFISCTNDEQEVNMVKPTNANSEIEVINDGTMIKFKDVESYENALLKVSAMSTSEQVSFLNSLSFKSQMILMQEADGELDKNL